MKSSNVSRGETIALIYTVVSFVVNRSLSNINWLSSVAME